jgi:hypothetical protein
MILSSFLLCVYSYDKHVTVYNHCVKENGKKVGASEGRFMSAIGDSCANITF